MNLAKIGDVFTRGANRALLLGKKYSPEILVGMGVVGVVSGAIMLCKETYRINDILYEHNEALEEVHDSRERLDASDYSDMDYKKDLCIVYGTTAKEMVKLYWPGAIMTAGGIVCFLTSYGILHKRNVALMAAYETLDHAYRTLEDKIRKNYGEEVLDKLKSESCDIEYTDEDGNKCTIINNKVSPYMVCFDESSVWWRKDPNHNKSFILSVQNWANDKLRSTGHLFLNEVYDSLDIPRIPAGQVVGWVLNNPDGDGYVDFNIIGNDNKKTRDFINGYERSIWLDFNVDGVVYNLI